MGHSDSSAGPGEIAVAALVERCLERAIASLEPPSHPQADATPRALGDVTVVVPIHDGFEHAVRCVDALLAHTPTDVALLLVDDASRDPRVRPWLADVASRSPTVRVELAPANRGYLATVNSAIARTTGDVVLLNSDAEVAPAWLERLAAAAHADSSTAIACPLSDNATLLTIVDPARIAACDAAARAALASGTWRGSRPSLPVAVGSCMYVKRAAIDALGTFDRAYGRGYGEENDWSLRAWRAGWNIVAAADVLVRHAGGASFGHGPETRRRRELGARILDARWPGWSTVVRGWWRDWPLREQAERMRVACSARNGPRVLHVAHALSRIGGTELHAGAIAHATNGLGFPGTLAAPGFAAGAWSDLVAREEAGLDVRVLNRDGIRPNHYFFECGADLSDPVVERTFARLVRGGEYALVHFHHTLNWNSAMLPLLARRLGARVVLAVHDFAWACPDYNMVLRPQMAPCGKSHAGVDRDCAACLAPRRRVARPDRAMPLDGYFAARREVWRAVVSAADRLVVPSRFVRERLLRSFGAALAPRIDLVPHGLLHDVATRRAPAAGRPLRAGFFGGTVRLKGFDLLVEVATRLLGASIAFDCYGGVARAPESGEVPPNMRMHGPQPPEVVAAAYRDLDLVLVPSRFEESFSLVVSEAWAAHVPVLVSDAGALAERVTPEVDGWVLPSGDAAAWADALQRLATPEGRAAIERVSATLRARSPRSLAQNASDIAAIYARLLALPRPAKHVADRSTAWDVASRRLRDALARLEPAFADEGTIEPLPVDARVLFVVRVDDATDDDALDATLRALAGNAHRVHDARHCAFAAAVATPAGAPVEWIVPLDAGDVPARALLERLATYDPGDVAAVYFEHALRGAAGRYGASAKPDWDRWQALGTAYAATAVAFSSRAVGASGGWRDAGEATAFATLLALERAGRIAHDRAVALWCHDTNLDRRTRESWQAAHRLVAAAAAGPGWRAEEDASGCGWRLVPPKARHAPIELRIWDDRGEIAPRGAVPLARQWTRYAALHAAGAATPAPYVLIARADLVPADSGWLESLLDWLEACGAAAVSAVLADPQGHEGAAGIGLVDGRLAPLPAMRATLACGDEATLQLHALASGCVLVRRGAFSQAELDALVGTALEAAYAAQSAACRRGAVLLRIGSVRLQVRGSLGGARAAATAATVAAAIASHAAAPWRAGAWRRGAPVARHGTPERPRVVAFARDDWGSSQYRVHGPLAALARAGAIAPATVYRTRIDETPDIVGLAELAPRAVAYHLWLDDAALALMQQHRRHLDARSVFLLDDLVTEVPPGHPMHGRLLPEIDDRLRRALALCDELVVSTAPLAERYGGYARSVRVVENALDLRAWPTPHRARRNGSRLRVGWAGAAQHQRDLALIDAVVRETADEYEWVFLGLAPASAGAAGARVLPMVPFDAYPEALASLELDVALAPLADDAYNRCKSALRLLEYGVLGIPVIASPLPAYRDAPVLLASDAAEWRAQLRQLACDEALRLEHGRALRDWVLARHDVAARLDAWRDAYLGEPVAARA